MPEPAKDTPSSIASIEHKAVVWNDDSSNGLSNFKTAVENEGVSTTDMDACSTSTTTYWQSVPTLDQKCLVELLLSTLEKENWTLTAYNAHNPGDGWSSRDAYHFTRPVQTS